MPFSEIGVDNDLRAFMIASRRIAARYLTLRGKGSRCVQNDSRDEEEVGKPKTI